VLLRPDLRAVRNAVIAGIGMTVLPRYLCAESLAAGTLIELVQPTGHPHNTLFPVWKGGIGPSARLDAVRGTLLAARCTLRSKLVKVASDASDSPAPVTSAMVSRCHPRVKSCAHVVFTGCATNGAR